MLRLRLNLAPVAIFAACCLGAGAAQAATVAYYQWENGIAGDVARGKGTVLDSSGNGLHGTPSGRPRYEAVDNPGSALALRFNGRTSRVWVPDSPLLELTHSLTLEAYLYIPDFSKSGMILIRGDSRYAFDPYYLSLGTDGILQFLVAPKKGRASYIRTPSPLPLQQWIHIAGTLDDATGVQALYVNHELVASTVTTVRPFARLVKADHAGLGIGGNIEGGPDQYYFNGVIDDVRISDVALDPSGFLPLP